MKFLGQMEASSFIEEHPGQAETVRAWLAEMRLRKWQSPEALVMDFRGADISSLPKVVFRLGQPATIFETLMDFRRGIILLTKIQTASRVISLAS